MNRIILILLLFCHCNIIAQEDCFAFMKRVNEEYTHKYKALKNISAQQVDSIYKSYLSKLQENCDTYREVVRFVDLYNQNTFYKLNDPKQAIKNLKEIQDFYSGKNDSITLALYNKLGIFSLRSDDFKGMKEYLYKGRAFHKGRLNPTFKECTRNAFNIYLYHHWLNQDEQGLAILQDNIDLIKNKKVNDIDFKIETYNWLFSSYLRLDELKAKEALDSLLVQYMHLPDTTKIDGINSYNHSLLELFLTFNKKDQAIAHYEKNLSDMPRSNDYDEIMMYIPLQLWTGRYDKAKQGLDTLNYYFAQRNMPKNHMYMAKKKRSEMMYFKALNRNDQVDSLLSGLIPIINQNLRNILFQNESDQEKTTRMLRNMCSKYFDIAYSSDNNPSSMFYDLQCNLKAINLNYFRSKREALESIKDEEFIVLLKKYKNLIKNLTNSISNEKGIQDSIKFIADIFHSKYLLNDITPKIINHRDIQDKLTDGSKYIEFYEGNIGGQKKMYAFIIDKNAVHLKEIKDYSKIMDLNINKDKTYINNKEINITYYDALLLPLREHLVDVNDLIISTDGLYNNISIEILSGDGKLANALLIDKNIKYTESGISALNVIAGLNNKNNIGTTKLFALAAIDYDCKRKASDLATTYVINRGERKQFLNGTLAELNMLKQISAMYNFEINYLDGCNANIENTTKKITNPNYNHLHIGTHGYYDVSNNAKNGYISDKTKSKILLAKSEEQSEYISAYDIANMNLSHINHCFLSSCNTSLGPYTPGQGNFSIAQAFKIAGVDKVISTLWEIPDEITAEFTNHYYSSYFTSGAASSALKFAKKELQKKYPPKAWAAFRLME